jgi:hypothetical protein
LDVRGLLVVVKWLLRIAMGFIGWI